MVSRTPRSLRRSACPQRRSRPGGNANYWLKELGAVRPGRGRKAAISDEKVAEIVRATLPDSVTSGGRAVRSGRVAGGGACQAG
jgi:hypothetical protein